MKKIFFFYFIILSSSYSQTQIHDFLKSLNGISESNISKSNRIPFYLGKDELSKFALDKVIELYNDSQIKSEYVIIPISRSNDYIVYVQIPNEIFGEKKNTTIFNVFDSFLIYDKRTEELYQIKSEMVCGSVSKKNKKTIITYSSYEKLLPNVLRLDNNLKTLKDNYN
ncbi:hypothetical protein [Flavobacterium sp.]|uniref:hypothetical protein n=1 Tax=Flavobacterium sp. TaxID=239 RepID=UPI0031E220D6